ncbi:UDP-GalNAc:beta-1,3-N-acetylgalactosaminyltransferase 2 isoform X2 [Gadus morhua]|uniref:UDP-GalNAc:beta-1, 3-N-acetylgalactosaminyltransferase 2 isoform X2 n=1 Tax=Gadus morhua TaxID=8049 RepID=UPI0011B77E1F|nr:UDP-GalNAc:beta-1,3-N-acetylgalactosaminyltransferase 2 isoform X2 [Gadus morhua]
MRSLALIILPCAVAVVVHLWLTSPTTTSLETKDSDEEFSSSELLVGVLSARHHHDLRQVIRDTWLGYLEDHPEFQHRVGVKFIVGRHGCPIPEEDREDPYSCSLLNLTETGGHGEEAELELVRVADSGVLMASDVSSVALDFKVLHPVVITRLGVFPGGPAYLLPANVTVKLHQLDQEEAVVSARFSALSPGTQLGGVWYKPVEQFILPKGFEGTLVWESAEPAGLTQINSSSSSSSSSSPSVELNTGGGVLKLGPTAEGVLPHRSALGFPGLAGGFTFTIYEREALAGLLRGRAARAGLHAAGLRQQDAALRRESLEHGDMVLVDVVDTYRSVPTKLLQFYKWSVKNAEFSLLLKTDDDCYIDVDAVLTKIDHKGLRRNNSWWGNFRQSWAVDRIGKWQELQYPSPAYPAFACGSGYVVSRDLVQWLADNADQLKAYQGEDVSMGIWMAAVGPDKYQDPGWLCEKECYQDMLSSPQHSPEELRLLWARKRHCGDPCGCPWGGP